MNKKLMAAAVAGALAMPGLALAQSSVTIGGFFKVGIENIKIDSASAARSAAGTNTSEIRMADNSSRIIFGVSEDLGGGMSAIAQLDNRFSPDNGNINATGNTWVGLKSNSWGAITMGRHDLHYGQNASDMGAGASALKATSISLMDYVNVATVAGVASSAPIANTTRTPNSLKWQSPNWSGFDIIAAYTTSPVAQDGDLASNVRKGYGWNINPHYTAENWGLIYSYWSAKPDGSLADQLGQNAAGYFKWGGFKIGVSYNQSKLKDAAGVDLAKRDAWSIPLSWQTGPHAIYAHYTKANKDKVSTLGDTSAAMAAVAYTYSLSKRTQVGVTYAQIRNEANAAYHFFTDVSGGDLSSLGSTVQAGEDPKLLALIMYHAF
ncbi:MAG TPA: porin [Burkholderiales bacterium]|nr:porin [Burkholderiales bacterium]